jgi:hypothetical protein
LRDDSRERFRQGDRGKYNPALAPKAFAALMTAAAKKYVREFGGPGDRWNIIFSPIDRRHAVPVQRWPWLIAARIGPPTIGTVSEQSAHANERPPQLPRRLRQTRA